ncbi:MAG: NirD/YgiW/YdeI family stress tolerance protein [Leptolyngbyaceae cyanobacterium MO_188.B28]|nr:NirD/YgiW/YdeI family stress tolerance protein [Leptolyngbyaceae cyanobacterium MO_188.B28]
MSRTKQQGRLLRAGFLNVLAIAFGSVTLASACAIAPIRSSANSELKISDILTNPSDGMPVTVRGNIFQKVDNENEEEYILADGVYEITLEIYEENFSIASGSLIEVSGEVDLESQNLIQHESHPETIEINVYQYDVIEP